MNGQLFETPPAMTERQWQSTIEKRLRTEEWLFQHIYRMKTASGAWRTSTTAVGFPDLTCWRRGYMVGIECKKGPKDKATPQQLEWLCEIAQIPTGRAWLLDPVRTDWQALANWLHKPESAPRVHGWVPTLEQQALIDAGGLTAR